MKNLIAQLLLLSTFTIGCQSGDTKDETAVDTTMNIKEETVQYSSDTSQFTGYVYYDANKEGKRPGIIVVHEWWGLTDYPKMRARQLAEMGYIAMAADMYGNGKMGPTPPEAQALATPFYQDPTLAKTRMQMALDKLKAMPQTDTSNLAAIGYCFGGYVVLNAAKQGVNLDGVVSFHGGLGGAAPQKDMKAKVLVAHGEADQFVPEAEMQTFKKQMDSVNAGYTIKTYPDATHAFTNPQATEKGQQFNIPIAYNAAADSASWKDMKEFFERVFR